MKKERNRPGPFFTDAKGLLPPNSIYDKNEQNMVTSAISKIQVRFNFLYINLTDKILIIYLIKF